MVEASVAELVLCFDELDASVVVVLLSFVVVLNEEAGCVVLLSLIVDEILEEGVVSDVVVTAGIVGPAIIFLRRILF